ncbi:DNA cytosine methyltransferase [Methylocystis suflitae]|uniref:DNA cytosine methyltransferase n=1 Tax=Methylocystis suflitae TaxID=2951405 RepID=UPI00210D8AAF|nr:DNA cytosine methyltransferase [Methylocystis suflitae]MCQ4189104.1 DNA cytosine methyltransferase [Methylocystis suflitae]
MDDRPAYYEFFAGGGMARAGLGDGWRCLFANDFDRKKAESYRANWGGEELHVGDVREISTAQLPGRADLVWASFPCQDLSLAGAGAGLKGERSGTFWPFWALMKALRQEGRAPSIIVLENVCGALTSHGGKDFERICEALAKERYRFGALIIDAALFVPQSRPRLFIVAIHENALIPSSLTEEYAKMPFHTNSLLAAYERFPIRLRDRWLWWNLPAPPLRNTTLADVVQEMGTSTSWHSPEQTQALLSRLGPLHRIRLAEAIKLGKPVTGTAFKRMRKDIQGQSVQRTEIRFDGTAGCLRTPAGGSSRQILLSVDARVVRSRLVSAREAARLMGVDESYILPSSYTDSLHLLGDGVAVPVVRYLSSNLLERLCMKHAQPKRSKRKKLAA